MKKILLVSAFIVASSLPVFAMETATTVSSIKSCSQLRKEFKLIVKEKRENLKDEFKRFKETHRDGLKAYFRKELSESEKTIVKNAQQKLRDNVKILKEKHLNEAEADGMLSQHIDAFINDYVDLLGQMYDVMETYIDATQMNQFKKFELDHIEYIKSYYEYQKQIMIDKMTKRENCYTMKTDKLSQKLGDDKLEMIKNMPESKRNSTISKLMRTLEKQIASVERMKISPDVQKERISGLQTMIEQLNTIMDESGLDDLTKTP